MKLKNGISANGASNPDKMADDMNRRQFIGAALAGGALLAAGPLAWSTSAHAAGQIELPPLPYAENALEPFISAKTLSFHYGKHHAGYVKNTNALLEGSDLAGKPLETVIREAAKKPEMKGLYNNAAQVWNHTFYWNSMTPGGNALEGRLLDKVNADFGSVQAMEAALAGKAAGQFGSGWAWLVIKNGKLACTNTPNADTPIAMGQTPLLCVDVWEHAYYLDYQNRRGDYVKAVLQNLANWEFAMQNFESGCAR
ncbi:MAG: superoxide dismutase [Pseudodesulfovibrio sp.]